MFGFDPDRYSVREDTAEQILTVSLVSGDPGHFLFILTAATNDSSARATATGNHFIIH